MAFTESPLILIVVAVVAFAAGFGIAWYIAKRPRTVPLLKMKDGKMVDTGRRVPFPPYVD